ncbi:MAG TPA: TraM recognition domain-containing protein [Saprospiraceae bacterium]|nr:TraM recognition domain-containing protein [Saprospiraceae bacterium]
MNSSQFNQKLENQKRLQKKLDKELLKFGNYSWTIRDAINGLSIMGSTGSGKSSGAGATIAKKYLENDFGGLVLCAKPSEASEWEEYCRLTNRTEDLIIVRRNGNHGINLLGYENRITLGGDETMNMTNLVMELQQIARNFTSGSVKGGSDMEGFWAGTVNRLFSRGFGLFQLASVEASIPNLYKLVHSTIKDSEFDELNELISILYDTEPYAGTDEEKKLRKEEHVLARQRIDDWGKRNFFVKLFDLACKNDNQEMEDEFELVRNYFLMEFPSISERTKSIIKETFNGIIEYFLKGLLKQHFSKDGKESMAPERTFLEGKIIVLAFDIKTFGLAGIIGQAAMKYIFQRSLERRNVLEEENPRPVFLWADESQFFVNPQTDSLFQTTARSSLVSTVYITQSLNNYFFVMGSDNPEAKTKALLANLNTKIFHNSSCPDTTKWATDLIGKGYTMRKSYSRTSGNPQTENENPVYGYIVEPNEFSNLKTGGQVNAFKTEAIIHINTDKKLSERGNFIKYSFCQEFGK